MSTSAVMVPNSLTAKNLDSLPNDFLLARDAEGSVSKVPTDGDTITAGETTIAPPQASTATTDAAQPLSPTGTGNEPLSSASSWGEEAERGAQECARKREGFKAGSFDWAEDANEEEERRAQESPKNAEGIANEESEESIASPEIGGSLAGESPGIAGDISTEQPSEEVTHSPSSEESQTREPFPPFDEDITAGVSMPEIPNTIGDIQIELHSEAEDIETEQPSETAIPINDVDVTASLGGECPSEAQDIEPSEVADAPLEGEAAAAGECPIDIKDMEEEQAATVETESVPTAQGDSEVDSVSEGPDEIRDIEQAAEQVAELEGDNVPEGFVLSSHSAPASPAPDSTSSSWAVVAAAVGEVVAETDVPNVEERPATRNIAEIIRSMFQESQDIGSIRDKSPADDLEAFLQSKSQKFRENVSLAAILRAEVILRIYIPIKEDVPVGEEEPTGEEFKMIDQLKIDNNELDELSEFQKVSTRKSRQARNFSISATEQAVQGNATQGSTATSSNVNKPQSKSNISRCKRRRKVAEKKRTAEGNVPQTDGQNEDVVENLGETEMAQIEGESRQSQWWVQAIRLTCILASISLLIILMFALVRMDTI
ncbi:uncharacterized protein PAC_10309 [Phialocephala subalpina]|uniref:Uncharacterized protein n=1 Tax=Phialocephala subalpina TaxID=576137 RepID=A0A1L7X5X2_9HELO|nr:uncharacterized protein PAC_10309 [Phialocephala subalpina]